MLANRNHSVDVADNGLEVLERIKGRHYDLILMDVQMPGMDGYEATSVIRTLEAPSGRRTPIVALTAHSSEEDCQKCLQADMDAYLTKPIDARRLVELVEGFARRSGGVSLATERLRAPSEPVFQSPAAPTFDIEGALLRLGGNRTLLESMSLAFQEESTVLVSELRRGLIDSDGDRVHRAAHSLGGLAAAFNARDAVEAAHRVEQFGRAGDLTFALDAVIDLEKQIERLRESLKEHYASSTCSERA